MANTIIAKIAARAKVIRKANPNMSWQSAIKKASVELKGRSKPTKSVRRNIGNTKQKSYDDVNKTYENAPARIKKVLDTLDDRSTQSDYKKVIAQLHKMGWKLTIDMNDLITELHPIKKPTAKRTTKKVGVVSKTKKGTPRKRLTKAEREYNSDVDLYKYFVVMVKTGNVQSGWEYKSDAQDALLDYDKGSAKIMTLAQMKKAGIKDPRNEYKHTVGAKKPISRHKDTKSHNVNIRVMSGTKLKIPKAGVDFNALNGIMQYEKGKFYEIAAPYRGTVVKITRIVKKNSKTYKNSQDLFFGDLYRYKNGYLHKPVKVQFYRIFLDQHNAIPRPSVKAHEYKKYV